MSSRRAVAARALARTPWTRAVRALERRRPPLRVVNYHATPAAQRDALARQLDHLLERFRPARADELERLVADGPGTAPAILFTFDDGLASHLEVAAPLLEERGATGIFAVAAEFPSVPADEQPRWYREHAIAWTSGREWTDEDLRGLDWDGVRELAGRGHRIAAHTWSHVRLGGSTPEDVLRREIVEARQRIEAEGVGADGFCWPWRRDPAARAADALVRATYAYALVGETRPLRAGADPYRVARTNLEAAWPLDVVDFQLSGVVDARFALRRVARR